MNPSERKIFTIANFFSFARLLLIWPIYVTLKNGTHASSVHAVLLMLAAAATDFLDGFFARKFNQKSDVGRVIDPLADKLTIGFIGVLLVQMRDLPLWFFILIIVRDLAILILAPFHIWRKRSVPESNWYGKIAVTALGFTMIGFALELDPWRWIVMYISLAILALSGIKYLVRFQQMLKES